MGCWNATCGISQLPIHVGDDVMVFLIVENKEHSGGADYCYATGYWKPILMPFQAKYNDYGSFEDIVEDDNFKYLLSYIQKNLVEVEAGENPYHEKAITKDKFDLEMLKDEIHEGRLQIKAGSAVKRDKGWGFEYTPHHVGCFMVHKHIWDKFSKKDPKDMGSGYFEKAVTEFKKLNQDIKNGKEDHFRNWTALDNWMIRDYRSIGMSDFLNHKKYFEDDEIDFMKSYMYFLGSMHDLRKGFCIQSGAGSQCEDDLFPELIKAMKKIMSDRKKKWED